MKECRKCGEPHPISHYGVYISGTVKPYCKACVALKQKEYRNRGYEKRPDYMPDCSQTRHPHPEAMKDIAKRTAIKYVDKIEIADACPKWVEAHVVDRVIAEML